MDVASGFGERLALLHDGDRSMVELTALATDPWHSVLAWPATAMVLGREIRTHAHGEISVSHPLNNLWSRRNCNFPSLIGRRRGSNHRSPGRVGVRSVSKRRSLTRPPQRSADRVTIALPTQRVAMVPDGIEVRKAGKFDVRCAITLAAVLPESESMPGLKRTKMEGYTYLYMWHVASEAVIGVADLT